MTKKKKTRSLIFCFHVSFGQGDVLEERSVIIGGKEKGPIPKEIYKPISKP